MKILVCNVNDVVEGEPLRVLLDGLPPLAVFKCEGNIFVTHDTCTHGNAMMSDGFQDGYVAECPFHGGSFDIRNGKPIAAPCKIPLKTYNVIIDGDSIYIDKDT
jgi:ethylbenzene dioxygenase ferredoxin subunit